MGNGLARRLAGDVHEGIHRYSRLCVFVVVCSRVDERRRDDAVVTAAVAVCRRLGMGNGGGIMSRIPCANSCRIVKGIRIVRTVVGGVETTGFLRR
jgi:hypothetical protein